MPSAPSTNTLHPHNISGDWLKIIELVLMPIIRIHLRDKSSQTERQTDKQTAQFKQGEDSSRSRVHTIDREKTNNGHMYEVM